MKVATSTSRAVADLFELDAIGTWRLMGGETDRIECKRTFRVSPDQRIAEVVKAIAGMANNKGGTILFGVEDRSLEVRGLADDIFENTDPASINRVLAGALDPVPHITKTVISLDGKKVGALFVQPHPNAPVIALKMMGQDVKEGCIYFRYVGETRTIKPGELRQIIAVREQRAVSEFSRRMMGVATGAQATLDLETGQVEGPAGAFVIDKELLPQLQFIREGDFSEVKGAPALRLIGDVQPIDREAREKARIIRDSVTPDAVIRNFLMGEAVAEPLQYVHAQAHCQRRWLPLWYYARNTGLSLDDLIEDLRSQVATNPSSRDALVQRLQMTQSAFKINPGRPAGILQLLLGGEVMEVGTNLENVAIAHAVMGLPDDFNGAEALKPIILAMLDKSLAEERTTHRSVISRAACRLDELLHR